MEKRELIEKVRKAKAILQLAIAEYDDIELKEATALRIEYTEKIGQYECRQYELYLQFEEIKYKLEMVQTRINRGEEIDMNAINNGAAELLSAYYERLNGMRKCVMEMDGYQNGALVAIESRAEIKRIYRKLMKQLHPDVADSEREFPPNLWEKVQDAYKRNDLATLQTLEDLVGENADVPLELKEESELVDMLSRMEMATTRYRMKAEEIRKRFPFTEAEHLRNDAWVRARQAEIKKSIEDYEASIFFLMAALNGLVEEEE